MNIRFEVVLGTFWTSHRFSCEYPREDNASFLLRIYQWPVCHQDGIPSRQSLSRVDGSQALPCAGPVNGGRHNHWEIDCIAVSCLEHSISQPLFPSSSSYIRLSSLWACFLNLRQGSIVQVPSVGTSIQFSHFFSTLSSHESLHSLLFIAKGSFFGLTRTSICLLGIIKKYYFLVFVLKNKRYCFNSSCSCHMPPDGSIRHSFQVALLGLTLPGNVI